MENLRDVQAQARSLERSGDHAAALELYARILTEPAADRDGGVWARAARLRLALGQVGEAAEAFATAADRYLTAGLPHLALVHYRRSFRSDDSRPEVLLEFGRLAAARGYGRDAREAFVDYADRAASQGDEALAAEALREYLARFPGDAAVRGSLSNLTGEEPAAPSAAAVAAAPEPTGALPGLIPTHPQEKEEAVGSVGEAAAPAPEMEPAAAAESSEDEVGPVERLEGFEPTMADALEAPHVEEEIEEEQAEPLPLLGLEPSAAEQEEGEAVPEGEPDEDGPTEELPLLGVDETPQTPAQDEVEERLATRFEQGPYSSSSGQAAAESPPVEGPAYPADAAVGEDGQAIPATATPVPGEAVSDARASEARGREEEANTRDEQGRPLPEQGRSGAPPREYVDLGELILTGIPEEVTRFQVAIGDPTGNEESDFEEILDLFRQKVSESLDPKDAASHYDLGLAFKQMGLLDDAIVHLQSGLRGGANPLATLEVLGECFVLKGQTSLAARVFDRATRLEGIGDSDLVGVLYGLARCQEDLGQLEEARGTYERIVAVDLSFRDAARRLQRLQSR